MTIIMIARLFLAAALLVACGDVAPSPPNIADPMCGRTATHAFTAEPGQCIRLLDPTGHVVFQRPEETGCDGVSCMRLEPGETAIVLARVFDDQPDGSWDVSVAECEFVPDCPAE